MQCEINAYVNVYKLLASALRISLNALLFASGLRCQYARWLRVYKQLTCVWEMESPCSLKELLWEIIKNRKFRAVLHGNRAIQASIRLLYDSDQDQLYYCILLFTGTSFYSILQCCKQSIKVNYTQ